ncbi:N-acetylmuramidase family protein [Salinarimonas sp.]|uniref:N-acetylmuramidase family protein n=1 Tax=Salinarimonas sp. TaxID=2766526 RepID=UPI00391B1AC2
MSVRSLFSSGRPSARPASGAAGGGLALDRGAPLTEVGFEAARSALGVDAPRLLAVMRIEAMGCGFLADRRPVILFERHVFHRRTAGRFDARDPDVSAPRPGLYGPAGANQHARLARARALDENAALESASWGLGQVMGFNARIVGFADVRAMVAAMEAGEDAQLAAMVAYIRATGLASALARGDWRAFARGYNGPDFARNAYDRRLAEAHRLYETGGLARPDLGLRALQMFLLYAGFSPGPIDGQDGPRTRRALAAFRAADGRGGREAAAPGEEDRRALLAALASASERAA